MADDPDLIVSVRCQQNTQAQQRGTFIHELGHNLNLGHNGNDDPSQQFSTIHESVMNYRYQFAGVPGTSRHTYSDGSNGCAPCATSPKASCIACQNALTCSTCTDCDCDVNEWGSVNYDFYEGLEWDDGVHTGVSSSPTSEDEKLVPTRYAGKLPRPTAESRLARALNLAAERSARGEVEGVHFKLNKAKDELHSICR